MRFFPSMSLAVTLATSVLFFLLQASPARADACRPPGGPEGLPRPEIPRGLPVDSPIDTTNACPAWHWVAVKPSPDAPCPDPGRARGATWTFGPLFEADRDLPPALRPFCLYRLEPGDAIARKALNRRLALLVRRGELLEVESSCAAVGAMAQGESDVRQLLTRHFLDQTGALASSGIDSLGAAPNVRLTLLDTQPAAAPQRPSSDHGLSLERMARYLVCGEADGGRCAIEIRQRLALPIFEFTWKEPTSRTFNFDNGGFFGTIDQLAQAVWEELEASGASGTEHLVLNLSVAWVGERFGGLEERVEEMPVPVRALHRALEVASCRGALVVAAAGNRIGGPELETGPLLPGGWERRVAPSPRDCTELLGETAPESTSGSRREPLVYAAGGVRTDGSPLANARPAAEPPRVAYADHAVVPAADDGPATAILTGSSVATTVVASAAAVVWHHRPELSRAEVMGLVERSGEPLARPADVHLGAAAPGVRRIGVCPALELACAEGNGSSCPGVGSLACTEPSPGAPRFSELDLTCTMLDITEAKSFDASTLTDDVDTEDLCASETLRHAGTEPKNPCPSRQFFTLRARPWTGPQPQNDPCSGCDIRPPPPPPTGLAEASSAAPTELVLRIDIDPGWPGAALEEAVLTLGDTAFALGLEPLAAGDCAVVRGIAPTYLAPTAERHRPSALLHFKTVDGSIESPLFIGR